MGEAATSRIVLKGKDNGKQSKSLRLDHSNWVSAFIWLGGEQDRGEHARHGFSTCLFIVLYCYSHLFRTVSRRI